MRRLALRGLIAQRLRFALTGLAVVIGVSFVAGTLTFTDALSRTFTDLLESTAADVNVTGARSFEGTTGPGVAAATLLPEELVEEVAAVDGVATATGYVQSEGVYVVGPDGKVVATGAAPGIGLGWDPDGGVGATLTDGREPRERGEIVLDEATAQATGYRVGDTVDVLTPGPRLEATVVGLLRFGDSGGLAGASLTAFDQATAQEILAEPGQVHGIQVAVVDGSDDDDVAARVAAALGDSVEVSTREEMVAEQQEALEGQLGFVSTFLLVFAGVALVVGSFIILNTFSMLVAQRTAQLALLRALGARRAQVTRLVMTEALVLGVVGSTVGLVGGLGLARLLEAAFATTGVTVDSGMVLRPTTVLASYAVGVLVTLVAAYKPARRAAAVAPVAALRDDQAMPERSLRSRAVVGGALAVLGGAALALGATRPADDGGSAAGLVGLGALMLLVATTTLSPVLAAPFVRVVGAGLPRLAGPAGQLARQNALRNPRRTAATASALMVGATLVSAFSIIGASAYASIGSGVEETVEADYVVSTAVGQPFSPQVAQEVRAVDGVAWVGVTRVGAAMLDGEVTTFLAADAATMTDAISLRMVEGSMTGFVVDTATARDRGWAVGDVVPAVGANGTTLDVELAGTYEQNSAIGAMLMPLDVLDRLGGDPLDRWLFVEVAEGADAAEVRAAAEDVLAGYPVVSLKDRAEFTQEQQASVGQILMIINAMLVLSVLIAVLGIVNTLALSVLERTREIGLLRAVGMQRRQLRRVVRWEAVLIALFGVTLGLALGVLSGTALVQVLDGMGIDRLDVPTARLAGLVVIGAVVGVLAAVWPARRASRLPVLQAIATTG